MNNRKKISYFSQENKTYCEFQNLIIKNEGSNQIFFSGEEELLTVRYDESEEGICITLTAPVISATASAMPVFKQVMDDEVSAKLTVFEKFRYSDRTICITRMIYFLHPYKPKDKKFYFFNLIDLQNKSNYLNVFLQSKFNSYLSVLKN